MRVAFISRASMHNLPGGDTVQMQETARALSALGVEVELFASSDAIDYGRFDLLHFFNIIRPADILVHQQRSGLPSVISTIFVEYHEYDRTMRGGLSGKLARVLGPHQMEYLKAVGRHWRNGEKIQSAEYWRIGQAAAIRKAASNAAMLLPNSHSEYQRFRAAFGADVPYKVVTNAIDPERFGVAPSVEREANRVLCVGKIEGIKNQLNLIRAVKDLPVPLVLVGKPVPNQPEYLARCNQEAGSNVRFVDHMPQDELVNEYARAAVHVLPSWFETTGLSSLEAAALGCRLVISNRGDAPEYFQDYAHMCEPDKVASIRTAIQQALAAPANNELREKVLAEHTWAIAAAQTLEAYKNVLSSR